VRPEGQAASAPVPPGPVSGGPANIGEPSAPSSGTTGAPDRDPRGAIPLGGGPGSVQVPVPGRRRPPGDPDTGTGTGTGGNADAAERGAGRRRAEDGLNGTAAVGRADGLNGTPPVGRADPRTANGTPAAGSPMTASGSPMPPAPTATGSAPQRTETPGPQNTDASAPRGLEAPAPRSPEAPGPRGPETPGTRGPGPAAPRSMETTGGPAPRPEGSPWTDRTAPPQPRPQGQPAAGWATVPTSGIPTLTGPAATGPQTPAAPATDESASRRSTAAGTAAGPQRFANLEDADRMTSTVTPDRNTTMPRAGRRAAPEAAETGRRAAAEAAEAGLRPGDVNQIQIAFWDEEAIAHYRSAWHELRGDFVDDPVTALTRAHDLLTEAVNELTEALLAERDELDPLRSTATPDTESMRMAMRGYREFLERILAL
jgi:hypothetical protein